MCKKIVITEFMDERAVESLAPSFMVTYDRRGERALGRRVRRLHRDDVAARRLPVDRRPRGRAVASFPADGRETSGKTLGVVGFGDIGKLTAQTESNARVSVLIASEVARALAA